MVDPEPVPGRPGALWEYGLGGTWRSRVCTKSGSPAKFSFIGSVPKYPLEDQMVLLDVNS